MSDQDPYAQALLEAALAYASMGWLVVPCHTPVRVNGAYQCSCKQGPACGSPGKHPRTKNGLKDASSDPDQIRNWWSKWPRANVAVIAGKSSNLVVLDFDVPAGGGASLDDLDVRHGPLDRSASAKTGNGLHLYYQHEGTLHIASEVKVLGNGVDVRADDGYVIAPPSVHYSGKSYEWASKPPTDPSHIPSMPGWLVRFFRERAEERQALARVRDTPISRQRDVSLDEKLRRCQLYVDQIAGVAEGGRNDAAAKNACPAGKDFDLEEDEFWPILCSWNERNSPPLDDRELRRTLASANRSRKYPVGCKLHEDSPNASPTSPGYLYRISQMSKEELVEEIAHHVHEACVKSSFGRNTSSHDEKCKHLYALCVAKFDHDLYQEGWAKGTETLRA